MEAEHVSRFLKTKEIQLPSNNKWLLDSINWYKSHIELRNIYQSLEDYVCIQWLLSDLQEVQYRCFPTNCKNEIIELTGKYCVQVNWIRDISQPCYTQLQAIKNNNIADSNEHVTAEDTKKQNWEPSPKRVLMMEITDGFTTLKAMEHSPIHKFTEPFIPGFKVVLIGPIECRKGVLFLNSNNISLLGGEVDYMSDMYSKENVLSRCLNIIPPPNDESRRVTNSPVSPPSLPPPRVNNNRAQPLINDIDQLPDSTSFIENNPYEDNRDALMADDDDDDMFCQLPDSMFNDADNFDPQPNSPQSPVLDEDKPEEVQSSNLENIPEKLPVVDNTCKNVTRPKLFPSMEDLRPGNKSTLNIKQSIVTTLGSESTPNQPESSSIKSSVVNLNTFKNSAPLSNKPSHEKQHTLQGSIPSLNNTAIKQVPVEPEVQNFNDSISKYVDCALDETDNENIYPQFKRVKIKVVSITKLKIRNGEWNCLATVSIEDKIENVKFCDKLLEKLFGTSAAEVEVLRSEMLKNQSLKEKINDILKSGQTKLKLLNCEMIVEYSSEDCTPTIVSIHEE